MKSLFLLNTQISPGGFGNTTYRIRAGEGKSTEGGHRSGWGGGVQHGRTGAKLLILRLFLLLFIFLECLLYDGRGAGFHQIVQLGVQINGYGWHMQDNVT